MIWQTGLPWRVEYVALVTPRAGHLPIAAEVGALAPAIRATRLNGEPLVFDAETLRGRPVVINFWASWCVPCRREMPALQALAHQGTIRVIGINVGEPASAVRAWIEAQHLTFEIGLDPEQRLTRLYGIPGVPSTFFVAGNGIIRGLHYGEITPDLLRDGVRDLLSTP